ncbi:MAG: TetR/AcrR family transcriptional regulator [Phycisphaerae bacterium]|nr:TetR/AcrR family transcriptional regulator [Phycisphaerae bacterium]
MAARLSRKQRELERHRREVLEAALNLFSRKGFAQTTMAEIAERAEFAVGTLYKLFKDKDALYRSLILETAIEFEQALTKTLQETGTETQRVERYIETKAALFVKHVPTARIYFSQTFGPAIAPFAGLDREAQVIHKRVVGMLESVLARGMRKKLFVKMDPKMLALGLEGLSNAFLLELIDRPDDFTAEEMAGLVKRMFFERIRLDSANQ